MERLRKSDWIVRPVSIGAARSLVEAHHYAAGASNTATGLHGLFHVDRSFFDADCVGVAWWIPPTKSAALATFEDWRSVLCLSRLAIKPDVPANAASFLLARSRRLIDRCRWRVLVTYADEWRGHTGAIYRADNWTYAGRTRPERTYVKEGRMIARKAGPKTRTHREMIELGAELVGSFAKHKFIRTEHDI